MTLEASFRIFQIEKLLNREVNIEHEAEIRGELSGKSILVTGAGGSIGSELVRQILAFQPKRLILLDNSEYNLFRVSLEFGQPECAKSRRFVMANIRDVRRLRGIFEEEKPEIVFHTAAYKHVPLLESNCYEAFVNNIIGTKNLLEVAASYQVKRFVLISTDKAVEPTSVMGCSKRITELLVQEFIQNGTKSKQSPYSMATGVVRFGNVINSAGSVIPLFREQILAGGPITVTHPEIERYFMSIREAVRLVLTAGTLGEWGELYVLDMGKKIKLVDVASKMLALYGRRDIPIAFTGLRPGEKLTEELTNQCETFIPTRFSKVRRVKSPALKTGSIEREVMTLESELSHISDREIGERMFAIVARAQEAKRLAAGA